MNESQGVERWLANRGCSRVSRFSTEGVAVVRVGGLTLERKNHNDHNVHSLSVMDHCLIIGYMKLHGILDSGEGIFPWY